MGEIVNRLHCPDYRRTKVKKFLKKSKRITIVLNGKHEIPTVTGYAINKNGKTIFNQ